MLLKIKKENQISKSFLKKLNSLKNDEILGVPLLNFEGVGPRCQISGSGDPWSHFYTIIVCIFPTFCGGGGWTSNQIFKKGGLDRTLIFIRGLVGKRGLTFLRGGGRSCNFYIKDQLKCEIFNDKKRLETKMFFSVMTKKKNLNWKTLTKNLVIFKR